MLPHSLLASLGLLAAAPPAPTTVLHARTAFSFSSQHIAHYTIGSILALPSFVTLRGPTVRAWGARADADADVGGFADLGDLAPDTGGAHGPGFL